MDVPVNVPGRFNEAGAIEPRKPMRDLAGLTPPPALQ